MKLPGIAAQLDRDVLHCSLSLLFYTAKLLMKCNPRDDSLIIHTIQYVCNPLMQWISRDCSEVFGKPDYRNTMFTNAKEEIKVCMFYILLVWITLLT